MGAPRASRGLFHFRRESRSSERKGLGRVFFRRLETGRITTIQLAVPGLVPRQHPPLTTLGVPPTMRRFVHAAVALALASAPGFANENEWSSLDQEINNLSTSLSAQNAAGPKIGGFIRTSFRYSDDQDALDIDGDGAPGGEDEMGFKLDKVRVEISGD